MGYLNIQTWYQFWVNILFRHIGWSKNVTFNKGVNAIMGHFRKVADGLFAHFSYPGLCLVTGQIYEPSATCITNVKTTFTW